MDKNIHVSMLFDMYGKLLTIKQQDVIELYYNQNLSLSEIAEETNITRQGVRKNLIDAENKLFDYEEKLCFLKEKLERQEKLENIINKINDDAIIEELQKLL